MLIKDFSNNDKPREKALLNGINSLSDAELISILIRTGCKDKSAIELSYQIISKLGGVNNLSKTNINELKSIKGIGTSKALIILGCIELSKRIESNKLELIKINSVNQIYEFFKPFLKDETQENFYIILLDSKHRMIKYECLYKGGLNIHYIHPRDIFRSAVKENASSLIMLHNHPSGDPSPSNCDIESTKLIDKIGKEFGIPLIDHIIIGDNNYVSMKLENLF